MEVSALSINYPREAASATSAGVRRPQAAEPVARSADQETAGSPPPARQAGPALGDLELNFKVKVEMATDESTGRQVVKIMSQDGKRVLRQMPPEEALELAAAAREGSVRSLLTSLV